MKTNISEREEERWEKRHLKEGKDWAERGYWEVKNHPATHLLFKKIENYVPFSSILEIGCNCGPNLYLIAKRFPRVKITGIDINLAAIKTGRKLLEKEGIKNTKLLVAKAHNLGQFEDKNFDIVFSKAVLVHIGPGRIKEVVKEMARLARKAVILIEYNCEDSEKDFFGSGIRLNYSWRWRRNYATLFKKFLPQSKITVGKIPENIWEGGWNIIEILL